ncbi:hypothetical protein C8J56DRAFT_1049912 [Mycena floridula]|nr:hypothetical protein C8J56DRAFT_1049912 [Mycena floridula]
MPFLRLARYGRWMDNEIKLQLYYVAKQRIKYIAKRDLNSLRLITIIRLRDPMVYQLAFALSAESTSIFSRPQASPQHQLMRFFRAPTEGRISSSISSTIMLGP